MLSKHKPESRIGECQMRELIVYCAKRHLDVLGLPYECHRGGLLELTLFYFWQIAEITKVFFIFHDDHEVDCARFFFPI